MPLRAAKQSLPRSVVSYRAPRRFAGETDAGCLPITFGLYRQGDLEYGNE
jgi:hypothetical protein